MRVKRDSGAQEAGGSFTSMIDIVFLLLIFFILQPFKEPEVSFDTPLSGVGREIVAPPCEDIRLRVMSVPADPTNAYYVVDGRSLGTATQGAAALLPKTLSSISGGLTDTPVKILPDARVHFGHVLSALDACHTARLGKVTFGFGE